MAININRPNDLMYIYSKNIPGHGRIAIVYILLGQYILLNIPNSPM